MTSAKSIRPNPDDSTVPTETLLWFYQSSGTSGAFVKDKFQRYLVPEFPGSRSKQKRYPVFFGCGVLFLYKLLGGRGRDKEATESAMQMILDRPVEVVDILQSYDQGMEDEHTTSRHPDSMGTKERKEYLAGTRVLLEIAKDSGQLMEKQDHVDAVRAIQSVVTSVLSTMPSLIEQRMSVEPEQLEQLQDIAIEISNRIADGVQNVGVPGTSNEEI